ncbi:MAG: hypothetical protein XD51_1296, partial [Moorella sp. 60_41]
FLRRKPLQQLPGHPLRKTQCPAGYHKGCRLVHGQPNSLIKSLEEKYGASGYLELEEKIRRGDVPEHPTWEDVILWEELSRHTEALQGLVRRLEAGEAVAS